MVRTCVLTFIITFVCILNIVKFISFLFIYMHLSYIVEVEVETERECDMLALKHDYWEQRSSFHILRLNCKKIIKLLLLFVINTRTYTIMHTN